MTAKHLTRTKAGKALLSPVRLALLAVAHQSLGFSDASFLKKGAAVDTPASPGLSKTLVSLIHKAGVATPFYNNRVDLIPATLTLGPTAPGTSRTYAVRLTYAAAGANPALQGASTTLPLQFTGVSQ